MGQVVAGAVAKFAGWLFSSGVGPWIARAALTVGLSVVTSKLFAPKRLPAPTARLSEKQITTRSALEYRKIVYGQTVVSGPIVYTNLSGSRGEYLWYVIALCDGRSEEITGLYMDGDYADGANIGWTPGIGGADGVGDGTVNVADYRNVEVTPTAYALRSFWTLGHEDQVAMSVLDSSFTDWSANHRLRGVTYGAVSMLYDKDTEEIWSEKGQPRDIKWVVKGRLLFDPRKYALNADPGFNTVLSSVGATSWFSDAEQTADTDIENVAVSNDTLSVVNDSTDYVPFYSDTFPVHPGNVYTITATARRVSGDRLFSFGVLFRDSNGNAINVESETGWNVVTGTTAYVYQNLAMSGTYSTYSLDFGSGGSASMPANAVTAQIIVECGGLGTTITNIQVRDAAVYEGVAANRHDPDDIDTWEWSDNPALCLADYLTQIMGVEYDDIRWHSVRDEAYFCDELVEIGPVQSPPLTQKRFTCNGALSLGQSHKDNIDEILSSFDAKLIWKQGRWSVRGSRWIEPTITLDADWLTDEPIDIQATVEESERFNTIEGFFSDPNRDYEAVEYPPVSAAQYVTRDGGRQIVRSLELPMTNDPQMAQRVAYRLLEQGNNQIVMRTKVNAKGLQLGIGDQVRVDLWPLGWTTGGNAIADSAGYSGFVSAGPIDAFATNRQNAFGRKTAMRLEVT